MSRRLKSVCVDMQVIADILRPRSTRTQVTVNGHIPEDAHLERVWLDPMRDGLMLTFSHPSWDEVSPGHWPPDIGPVLVRHGEDN